MEITTTRAFINGITVEISDTAAGFCHRLVYRNCRGNIVLKGTWATYRGIARLAVPNHAGGHEFAHVTEFYAGIFPVETPFLITPLKEA